MASHDRSLPRKTRANSGLLSSLSINSMLKKYTYVELKSLDADIFVFSLLN
jgi:hypothetical protein